MESSNAAGGIEGSDQEVARKEALRWVRKKRILYTILGIYAVLSLMWFTIDMADGTESLWFYWPMLGTGAVVAVTAVIIFGIGGLFGVDWERRQVQRYLERRDRGGEPTSAHTQQD
jgi:2TM domain